MTKDSQYFWHRQIVGGKHQKSPVEANQQDTKGRENVMLYKTEITLKLYLERFPVTILSLKQSTDG